MIIKSPLGLFHFNLKLTGIDIQTPTGLSRCFAGLKRVLRIAEIAASSKPVLGIPFNITVSLTRPFLSINTCTTTVPSMPASWAISGYTGLISVRGCGGSS